MLRDPNNLVNADDLPAIADHSMTWYTLHCELVTPMYGGGVEAATVDKTLPIRAMSIRGALRFWWRLLAKHKYKWEAKKIAKAETDLWGGIAKDGDDGKASKVLIRVDNVKKVNKERWATYKLAFNKDGTPKLDKNGEQKEKLIPKNWTDVPYALFPAQGRTREKPNEEPHELLREGLTWDLLIRFTDNTDSESQKQVWETIRWWANFGGIGARTRRGLGAVSIKANQWFEQVIPLDEVSDLGFSVKSSPQNSPYGAWKAAVEKLQSFRQEGAGRDTYQSRSRWSEPDAIRRITGQTDPRHNKKQTEGDIFPRAAFGLPIIFKFSGNPNDSSDRNKDPSSTTLNLALDKEKTRFASPLILRPYFDGKNWRALALVLPDKLEGILEQRQEASLQLNLDKENSKDVVYWDEKQTSDIKPIADNGGGDPLQAFLRYFAN